MNVVSEQAQFESSEPTIELDGVDGSESNWSLAVNCVDLFAGAGGFSLAAQNVGINVVAAVEFNKNACATYSSNLIKNGIPHLYGENIRELEPAELVAEHFSAGAHCDLLLGGPPCQGFSVHRIRDSGVGDPRNELILRYFHFVRCLQPKVFLMENVPGLLWSRHKSFLDDFFQQGRAAGYVLSEPVILDARDYGLPQRRKRVFVLGIKGNIDIDIKWPPPPTHGDVKAIARSPFLRPWVASAEVFDKPIAAGDENAIHMNHTPALTEVFRNTPLNGGSRKDSGRILACHAEHDGHADVYGRIDPSQPGPTMTTACINPSKGRFVHPTEHHGITVRQAARFQTFPDSFVFKGGLMASGEQIGNAVPIKLGEVLLRAIKEGLMTRVHTE